MGARKITILGGGQAGLQLACRLLQKGYEMKVVQNRTAEAIHTGRVMSSQCMFGQALQHERNIGLDFWAKECCPRRKLNPNILMAQSAENWRWKNEPDGLNGA